MTIKELMTAKPELGHAYESLEACAKKMWDADVGVLPILDEWDRLSGIITDRDICMAAHLEGQPLRARTVDMVMSSAPQVCHCEDSLQEAAAIMRETKVRRLPVVDRDGHLAGVVSINDLVLGGVRERTGGPGLAAEEIVATLTAICEHRPNRGSAEPR